MTVLTHDAGPVRTLTLNRPERRNALTPEMQDELTAALEAAGNDPGIRVLILTGAGDSFCAGLDLIVLQSISDRTASDLAADAERIARMFRTLYELPLPTIALVNGHAIAGGTGLATLCDFTFAVPGTKFGYTEARIGFLPALVSAYLTLQIGERRARNLLLSARLFDAAEACTLGLVTALAERDVLQKTGADWAEALLRNSPESLRATKKLLADQNRAWLDQALAHALAAQAESRTTADFREGIIAFLDKRSPRWT